MNGVASVLDPETLQRGLRIAPAARALVLIAHPDAASRASAGHGFVADVLRANGLATLSFNLRGPRAADGPGEVLGLVQARLRVRSVIDWVSMQSPLAGRPVVLVGIGDAVAGCVGAAARHGTSRLHSLVLLDGRSDQVPHHLARLALPTLFVFGRCDARRIARHRVATRHMSAGHRLEVLGLPTLPKPAPGALESFALQAMHWLDQTLPKPGSRGGANAASAAAAA